MKAEIINIQFKNKNAVLLEIEITPTESRMIYNALQCYANSLSEEYENILDSKCVGLIQPASDMLEKLYELKDKVKDLELC